MEDFDWIGVEWIWRGMVVLFVALVLDGVALMMWIRDSRNAAFGRKQFSEQAKSLWNQL
jgi:hypothetical protein